MAAETEEDMVAEVEAAGDTVTDAVDLATDAEGMAAEEDMDGEEGSEVTEEDLVVDVAEADTETAAEEEGSVVEDMEDVAAEEGLEDAVVDLEEDVDSERVGYDGLCECSNKPSFTVSCAVHVG